MANYPRVNAGELLFGGITRAIQQKGQERRARSERERVRAEDKRRYDDQIALEAARHKERRRREDEDFRLRQIMSGTLESAAPVEQEYWRRRGKDVPIEDLRPREVPTYGMETAPIPRETYGAPDTYWERMVPPPEGGVLAVPDLEPSVPSGPAAPFITGRPRPGVPPGQGAQDYRPSSTPGREPHVRLPGERVEIDLTTPTRGVQWAVTKEFGGGPSDEWQMATPTDEVVSTRTVEPGEGTLYAQTKKRIDREKKEERVKRNFTIRMRMAELFKNTPKAASKWLFHAAGDDDRVLIDDPDWQEHIREVGLEQAAEDKRALDLWHKKFRLKARYRPKGKKDPKREPLAAYKLSLRGLDLSDPNAVARSASLYLAAVPTARDWDKKMLAQQVFADANTAQTEYQQRLDNQMSDDIMRGYNAQLGTLRSQRAALQPWAEGTREARAKIDNTMAEIKKKLDARLAGLESGAVRRVESGSSPAAAAIPPSPGVGADTPADRARIRAKSAPTPAAAPSPTPTPAGGEAEAPPPPAATGGPKRVRPRDVGESNPEVKKLFGDLSRFIGRTSRGGLDTKRARAHLRDKIREYEENGMDVSVAGRRLRDIASNRISDVDFYNIVQGMVGGEQLEEVGLFSKGLRSKMSEGARRLETILGGPHPDTKRR